MEIHRRAIHNPENIVAVSHALRKPPLRGHIAYIGIISRISISIRADIDGIDDRDIECNQIKNIQEDKCRNAY